MVRESLASGKTVSLTVSSNSMSPLFWRGDEIVLAATEVADLTVGDVITVAEENGFLTHRYWGQTEAGLLRTKGDRSLLFDAPWQTAVLIGRVVARQRGSKILWLDKGRGRWLVNVLGKITAVEQHLFANHNPTKLWIRISQRLFLILKWGLTLIVH